MSVGASSVPNNAKAARRRVGCPGGESEWRLPSGEDLIAFALAAGFAAGSLATPLVYAGRPERWAVGLTQRRELGRRS
jgi:hypothetical protein